MKRILILLLGLFGVAYGQYQATSAKTKFVNGLSIGSKDSTYFTNAGDTVVLYIGRDSAVYTRFKGYHRKLSFVGDTTAMLLPYLRNSDTAAMLNPYLRKSDTATILADYVDLGSTQTIAGLKTFTGIVNSGGGLFATGGSMWASGAVESFVGSIGFGNGNAARVAIYDDNGGMAGGKNVSFIPAYSSPSTPRAATNSSQAGYYFSKGGSVNFYANSSVSGDAIAIPKLRVDSTGDVRVFSTTASSSTTTGALIVSGGVGAAGNINAASFIRSGGTSSQFLKADGSVDGTSYATAASLSGYLPLSGGTLTGALNGTSVSMSDVNAITLSNADSRIRGGTITGRLLLANSGTTSYAIIYGSSHATTPNTFSVFNDNTESFRLSNTGAATFYNALNGTSLSMSGALSGGSLSISSGTIFSNSSIRIGNGTFQIRDNANTATYGAFGRSGLIEGNSNTEVAIFAETGFGINSYVNGSATVATRISTDGTFLINTTTTDGTNKLIVNGGVKFGTGGTATITAAGAATFSSSVKASSFISSGGTSSQSLMADGSVQTVTSGTYSPTLTGVTNISSVTLDDANFTRVGSIVTVYVSGTVQTTASGASTFTVTVPITNVGSTYIGFGNVNNGNADGVAGMVSSSTTTAFKFDFNSINTTSRRFSISFQYSL